MFPFYFKAPLDKRPNDLENCALIEKINGIICNDNTLWVPKDASVDDNVLYEYIRPNTKQNTTPFLAYTLRSFSGKDAPGAPVNELKVIRNRVWEKLEAEMEIRIQNNMKKYCISFGRDFTNWNGPTLLISPLTGVGMLVLSVNPNLDNATVNDVIDFNYHLHKIDGQQKLLMPSRLDKCPNENATKARTALLKDVATYLNVGKYDVNVGVEFKLRQVVDMFLRGMPDWELFEKGRAHVFTYYNFVQDTLGLTEEEKQAMILLTRCANDKYNIPVEYFDESPAYTATFQNIYMGCSIEGGCICTIRQISDGADVNNANGFIKEFALGALQQRYLWLYFMALIQRYTMLHMVIGLSSLDLHDENAAQREKFNEDYSYFCSTKIQGFFKNVSSFSQHNQYYKFLIDNMGVDELYQEVENKMQIVDSCLQMRSNELQMRRNELMKIRNEQNAARNIKLNKLSLWLSIFFAVATFSQTADSLYNIYSDNGHGRLVFSIVTVVIYVVAITFIYLQIIRKKNKSI